MSKTFIVKATETHEVEIETEAKDADEACNKIESGDWDETTFIVTDDTTDREVHSAEEAKDEEGDGI